MSIIAKFGLTNSPVMPYLNTRTMLDIAVGKFQIGHKGEWILNGGIAPLTAIVGRSGTYKSTTIDTLMVLLLKIYPAIEVLKYDTEMNALGVDRYTALANGDHSIETRIIILNKENTDGDDFVAKIQEIAQYRIEEKTKGKDLVETPFIHDNKPYKMLVPFLVDIDSFSMMSFPSLDEVLSNNAQGGNSKSNTFYMGEGNTKTKLMNMWIQTAHKANMYFIFTAQVDDEILLDPYAPQNKMQFMKKGDKIKRVGSQFEFLTNIMIQNIKSSVLDDSNKECLYPSNKGSANSDLSILTTRVLRCKTNVAGTDIPIVTSQSQGILPELTNYHYLKTAKWGLSGSDRSPRSPFHVDIDLARGKVRQQLENNYELARGIELLAQMKFIEENWTNLPFNVPKTAEEFVEQITKNSSIKIGDILNSRGYWTYDKKDQRKYMSVLDVVTLLDKKT